MASCTVNTYTVRFDGNNPDSGTPSKSSITCTYGQACPAFATQGSLLKRNSTFGGWNTRADGTGTTYAAGATGVQNLTDINDGTVTLYAIWSTCTPCSATNANCTPIVKDNSCSYHVTCATGYAFGDNTTEQTGTDRTYECIANKYNVIYSCGLGTGTAPADAIATYGTPFRPATNTCTKPGYNFVGWTVSDTSDVRNENAAFTWQYTSDKIFTATWVAGRYSCPAGKYLRGTDAQCVSCPAGKYCRGVIDVTYDGTDIGIDGECVVASYSTGGATNSSCTPCTTTTGWATKSPAGSTAYTECYQTQTPENCSSGTVIRKALSISGTTITYGEPTVTDTLVAPNGYSVVGTMCTVNIITLRFISGGHGTTPTSPDYCIYNSTFTMPAAMTATGYTFHTWDVNGQQFTGGQTNIACNYQTLGVYSGTATITGNWTTNAYNITYELDNGTNYTGAPTRYTYGIGAKINGIPTRPGYTFAGWCTDETLTSCAMSQQISTTTTGDVKFWALWCKNCDAKNANCEVRTNTAGACIYVTSCKTGYGNIINNEKYNPQCTANEYDITYQLDDGTESRSGMPRSYTYGIGTTINGIPTRTGYTFDGWCDNARMTGCTPTKTVSTTQTGKLTFWAKWTANEYNVKYSCDGFGTAAPANTTATFGKTFTPAENTCQNNGYGFIGWAVSDTDDVVKTGFTWKYITNKILTPVWDDSCAPGYELIRGACIPCERENAATYKTTGNCVIDTCVPGYHSIGISCEPNKRGCTLSNATVAYQTWNDSTRAYGICKAYECEYNYHVASNACIASQEICDLKNGRGVREWDERTETWGECHVATCNPGYTDDPSQTHDHSAKCGECANRVDKFGRVAVSSYARECEIAACMYQGELYNLDGNECVPICEDGQEDETGVLRWDNIRKKCERNCKAGYISW